MKKIMFVFGTRPEAIKMCPLVLELKKRNKFNVIVCVTGQHQEMLQQVLNVFGIIPDYNLNIMKQKQDLFDITREILSEIKRVLENERPDLVLVHGDTSTTFVSSLACFYLNIAVGHVEAGLRTDNIYSPYPEEFNRRAVSLLSRFHFAPTKLAKENLLKENKNPDSIFVTGNTVIDALKTTVNESYSSADLDWVGDSKLVLLTAHRRENLGQKMENIFIAIKNVVEEHPDVKLIYPVHLNPVVRETAHRVFDESDRIRLIEPLDVLEFHNLMARSYLILTDSGGIQEEAAAFGVPVLVLRDTTERPEGVEAGTLKLCGTKQKDIYNDFSLLLDNNDEYNKMSKSINPYGDGKASIKIADILEEKLL